jgi:hypothetical protein
MVEFDGELGKATKLLEISSHYPRFEFGASEKH